MTEKNNPCASNYPGISPVIGEMYDFLDKQINVSNHVRYMLARTNHVFKYNGLPDTIPHRNLELNIQSQGYTLYFYYNDKPYVSFATLGGEPDEYYMPTKAIVANPGLNCFKEFTIHKDCVVIPNDSMYTGLMPLMNKWATLLAENELSMSINDILSRIMAIISANDDNTKKAADKFIHDVFDGKIGSIQGNAFTEGISVSPYSGSAKQSLTDLIEFEQYCKASWFNDLGLNANYNMKREAINGNEADLNNDSLTPLIDDMLGCRKAAFDEIREIFGDDITVELDGAWEDNQIEINESQAELAGEDEAEEPNVESGVDETKNEPDEAETKKNPEEEKKEEKEEKEDETENVE